MESSRKSNTLVVSSSDTNSRIMAPHPLDPITPPELAAALQILRDHFKGARLRFKFVDLHECPKYEVVPYQND